MATLEGLSKQLHLIKMKVPRPDQNYLDSDEWPRILAVMRHALLPYPLALEALEQAVGRMVAPMSWRQVHHLLYRAIEPYMDARIAAASSLMTLQR
jgi:hypothetical protein